MVSTQWTLATADLHCVVTELQGCQRYLRGVNVKLESGLRMGGGVPANSKFPRLLARQKALKNPETPRRLIFLPICPSKSWVQVESAATLEAALANLNFSSHTNTRVPHCPLDYVNYVKRWQRCLLWTSWKIKGKKNPLCTNSVLQHYSY